MARAGQVEGQKPHPRRLHLDPKTWGFLMSTFVVWLGPGIKKKKVVASSLEACADELRRRGEWGFLVVPLEYWEDFSSRHHHVLDRQQPRGRPKGNPPRVHVEDQESLAINEKGLVSLKGAKISN